MYCGLCIQVLYVAQVGSGTQQASWFCSVDDGAGFADLRLALLRGDSDLWKGRDATFHEGLKQFLDHFFVNSFIFSITREGGALRFHLARYGKRFTEARHEALSREHPGRVLDKEVAVEVWASLLTSPS